MKKGNPWALLPILCFLVVFIGMGVWLNDFYAMPAIVGFLIALGVAFCQNRKRSFSEKMEDVTHSMGDSNVMIMCLVFVMAGGFSGAVQAAGGVDSTVNFSLSILPPSVAVAGLFIIGCFISTAMGTSVGTIAALAPIAVGISDKTGIAGALCIGAVVSGAMFGDNLSMISDTTIAATRTQGCEMKDKFRENFGIALPAAIASLALILVVSFHQDPGAAIIKPYNLIQLIPYLLVLAGGIAGIQVFVVLLVGIVSGAIIMLGSGQTTPWEMLTNMGSGTSGMFETSMVAILVAAMCALIRENGGFDVLLNVIHRIFRGKRGGQFGVGLLVTLLDIATANNTVAIVMANPIAKEISEDYGISARKTASLLDTFSCISQGILPYGAQMLVALSAVHELGYELSAFEVMPLLFYPGMLFISSLICIFLLPERGNRAKAKK